MKSLSTIHFEKARELFNKMVVCACGFDKALRISTCFYTNKMSQHSYNTKYGISKYI